MKQHIISITLFFLFASIQPVYSDDIENYTHKLDQSTAAYQIWTAPPSERIFKDDAVPEASAGEIRVYAAGNEFEPFLVVVKPASSGNIDIQTGEFGDGIAAEIYQVKYVPVTQVSDILGRTGDYPDPLKPLENGASVSLTANENTAFWINVHVPPGVSSGDRTANVSIGSVTIPVKLHVFNFAIPETLHVKSQMNVSHQNFLTKYSVSGTGSEYWMYVDKIKQYFIDHRLTPKSVLWSGGLTGSGAGPYIDYDCAGNLSDNDGIWGFEKPALRYLDGTGLMDGQFAQSFNGGTGFPSFMSATFRNNDASADQRPDSFCNISRGTGDWYAADNPNSAYNQKWFAYIKTVRDYLNTQGYLDKAYYYFANEPQDQADYDAVAWYSQELKKAASDFKLMVSEEPKPEIYSHPTYTGAKVDIWLPVLNNYDPDISHDRETNYGEETWIYFLHGTRPPYFNPVTLDHPGIESKYTGWFLWKYRIKGIAYYSLNNWSQNPWTQPLNDNHNGDLFMLYPPSESNINITYGSNSHRFVPSIRFELMRDSLEDYEYLYMLAGAQPAVGQSNTSDEYADKIISGLTSYADSSEFMYNLRRLIGLKIGGEITEIPDINPPAKHSRSLAAPGNYYINFQNPDETFSSSPYGSPQMISQVIDGVVYKMLNYNARTYFAIGTDGYDDEKGFGWYGNIILQPVEGRDPWGDETDETKRTYVGDNYGRVNTFEFALPNGTYNVELSVGGPRRTDQHNKAVIEGVVFVDDEPVTNDNHFLIRSKQVTVADSSLTVVIGVGLDEYTMLNYLLIEAVEPLPASPAADFSMDSVSGQAPLTVQFSDQTTENPTAWSWDFNNDGQADSSLQHPSYTFNAAGVYSVSLTASNNDGSDTETKTDAVTVYTYGDVNCDGLFKPDDAVYVLQILSGTAVSDASCPDLMGDFNKDGRICLEDAVGIMQSAAGLR